MKERTIERDRDNQIMPTQAGQDLEHSVGPWQTDGRVIQDADGRTIAVAVREADARLMATALRMVAILSLQMDAGVTDAYFQESVEEVLQEAGRELPVEGGGNGSE